jgi:hypothetical protein
MSYPRAPKRNNPAQWIGSNLDVHVYLTYALAYGRNGIQSGTMQTALRSYRGASPLGHKAFLAVNGHCRLFLILAHFGPVA